MLKLKKRGREIWVKKLSHYDDYTANIYFNPDEVETLRLKEGEILVEVEKTPLSFIMYLRRHRKRKTDNSYSLQMTIPVKLYEALGLKDREFIGIEVVKVGYYETKIRLHIFDDKKEEKIRARWEEL